MGLLRRYEETVTQLAERADELKDEIAELRRERNLQSKAQAAEEKALKQAKILEAEIESLTIQRDRQVETNERERREIEHLVGLERKRQEVEMAQAKKEAELSVREENLTADKQRFEDHVAFMEKRFSEEVTYVKEVAEKILDRLPTVTVDRQIEEKRTSTRAKR